MAFTSSCAIRFVLYRVTRALPGPLSAIQDARSTMGADLRLDGPRTRRATAKYFIRTLLYWQIYRSELSDSSTQWISAILQSTPEHRTTNTMTISRQDGAAANYSNDTYFPQNPIVPPREPLKSRASERPGNGFVSPERRPSSGILLVLHCDSYYVRVLRSSTADYTRFLRNGHNDSDGSLPCRKLARRRSHSRAADCVLIGCPCSRESQS